jgi:hypothetical protein
MHPHDVEEASSVDLVARSPSTKLRDVRKQRFLRSPLALPIRAPLGCSLAEASVPAMPICSYFASLIGSIRGPRSSLRGKHD